MTAVDQPKSAWSDALRAAHAFAVDPHGLGGARIRAAATPARDVLMKAIAAGLGPSWPLRRVPLSVSEETLSGSLDLAATRGLQYNPLTRRYRLSDDTSVNYLFACRKVA